MTGIADYLAMGGHGAFIWAAYAIAALVLLALLVASVAAMRRSERDLAALAAGATRRGRADLRRRQAGEAAP